MRYLDFDLSIERSGVGYRAKVLNSPSGQAGHEFSSPFSEQEMEIFFLRIGRPRRGTRRIGSPEMNAVKAFGKRLFDTVFGGDIRACLRSSMDEADRLDSGLRLRLRLSNVPELADLPWEYLHNSSLNRFLSLSSDTPVVRFLDLPERVRPFTIRPPIRILVMISSPGNYPVLEVEEEWGRLEEAVSDLISQGKVKLDRLESATLQCLQRRLRQSECHILHFIGHGGFDSQTEDGLIVLEDQFGRGSQVSGQYLGTLLHDHRPLRIVVLNSCEGARNGTVDPFSGLAQGLVQQGIPAVIAMQFEITDNAAIAFSHEFYLAISDGFPIDAAMSEARKAIFAQGNDVEWGTPVLYLRAPDGQVFNLEKRAEAEHPQTELGSSTRRDQEAEQAAMAEEQKRRDQEAEQARMAEEQKRRDQEAEQARMAQEQKRRDQEAEQARMSEEQKRRNQEAEQARMAEEQKRRDQEAEQARMAEEQKRRDQEAEQARVAEEQKRRDQEAEQARVAEEQKRRDQEAEQARVAEEQKRRDQEAEQARVAEEQKRRDQEAEQARMAEEQKRCDQEAEQARVAEEQKRCDQEAEQARMAEEQKRCDQEAEQARMAEEHKRREHEVKIRLQLTRYAKFIVLPIAIVGVTAWVLLRPTPLVPKPAMPPSATLPLLLASKAEQVVKIGHVAPLTGPIAHFGKDNENGARLAVDDANAKRIEIDGKVIKFELLGEDDQADPKTGTIVAQKLVDAKVAGVVGHLNSGTTIPASAIYYEAGLPQISPSSTNPKYTAQGFKTAFRVMANDIQQGSVAGTYAVKDMGAKKIAIIDDRTAYGQGLADEVEKAAKAAGASIVAREFTHDKATDFKAILTKIKAKNPDLVFLGGMDDVGGPMLKQMKELGIKAKFSTGDGGCSPELIKLAGAASEGVICTQAGLPPDKLPNGQKFVEDFTKKYGQIQIYSPYSYDAVMVLVDSMKRANSADPAKYLPEVGKTSYDGVTGKIEFDANGDIKNGAITVFEVKDGKLITVATR